MPGDPFRTDDLPLTPLTRAALRVARPLLERALHIDSFRTGYRHAQALTQGSFPARALSALRVRVDTSADSLTKVPSNGPLIVMANHPHGVIDGLALARVLEGIRPDTRILANHLLARIPEMQELCFFVDPFGGADAAARSRAGLRAAHLWLRQGHAVIAFPAGEVAHRHANGELVDSPWVETVGRLALATGAAVVPAFIDGTNSALFYAAGRVHPTLRTALLVRELMRQRRGRVRISLGAPLLERFTDLSTESARRLTATAREALNRLAQETVSGDSPCTAWEQELAALPARARLIESGHFAVYCAGASDIPHLLSEIGRLREVTYRAVGEGTGQDYDLDRFDQRYTHLFVWDRQARVVVGAYRIGDVAAIVRQEGVEGLYTRELFKYDERFIRRMGPALELGRSWVRAEYQKNYNALLLLWRGVGRFIVERTNARVLFGPVSISARYSDASHTLLMAFLAQNHRDSALAELVEAIHPRATPAAPQPGLSILPRSIDEANILVSRLEADGKGVPVLLRQYLKLNARLLGFNVDPNFGDALDALMMVDLTTVDASILQRYLGKEVTAAFLTNHRRAQRAA